MAVRQGFVVGSQFDPESAFSFDQESAFSFDQESAFSFDPESAFSFAAARGFDFVELNMEHAFHRDRVDPARVRSLAAERGLAVVVHLPYRLDPASPHEHVREGSRAELEAALDVAAEFGAEKAVMHAATVANEAVWDHEAIRANVLDAVRRVAAHGRSVGVEVCVENLKGAAFDVFDFPRLFAETGAAMCLDTGHAHVSGMDGPGQAAFLSEHGDRVSHVHLNDTRLGDDDEHLPVGLGYLDLGALADAMVETGWEGTATHEMYGFDLDYAAAGKRAFDELLGR